MLSSRHVLSALRGACSRAYPLRQSRRTFFPTVSLLDFNHGPVEVGDTTKYTFNADETMIQQFADFSEDNNPIHFDPEFAKTTRFGRPIAQGCLTLGAAFRLLERSIPGHHVIQSDLRFPAPVYVGDNVSVEMEVTEKWGREVRMKCTCKCEEEDTDRIVVEMHLKAVLPKDRV